MSEIQTEFRAEAVSLEIDRIRSSDRMLRDINDNTVSELVRSISSSGLMQPVMVRKSVDMYEIVFGNHRFEAYRRLGKKEIPAIITSMTDDEVFLAQLTENLVRNTYVNPIEEAKGYRMLVRRGWTIHAIGCKVGKCDSYISERLSLLDRLDHRLLSKVSHRNKYLTPSHAELLARVRDHNKQIKIAEMVERKRLSVRSLEAILENGALPGEARVEKISGNWLIHIPNEFASVLHLSTGQSLHIQARRNKLILEDPTRPTRGSRTTRNLSEQQS